MHAARCRSIVGLMLLFSLMQCAWAQGFYGTRGAWVDDQDHAYSFDSLSGSFTIVTMAYGACRRVCSTSLRIVKNLHELAQSRHVPVNFVVVGLDPVEDKPADWATYRAEQKLMFSDLQFLTGNEASISQLAGRLGFHYWRYGEHVMHDFRIVLVSPQGKVVRSMDSFDDDPALLLP